jgi:hypothetical protein
VILDLRSVWENIVKRAMQTIGLAVATVALAATAACGGSSGSGTPAGGGTTAPRTGASTTATSTAAHATLTLTGTWTYSGQFSGHLVCFHSDSGHFEFEGQQPYLVDITVDGLQNGTFTIPNYTRLMTGQVQVPSGQPKIKVSRLQKVGDSQALNFPADGGSIDIGGSGASGTAKWTSTGGGAGNVTAEVHWENCGRG